VKEKKRGGKEKGTKGRVGAEGKGKGKKKEDGGRERAKFCAGVIFPEDKAWGPIFKTS